MLRYSHQIKIIRIIVQTSAKQNQVTFTNNTRISTISSAHPLYIDIRKTKIKQTSPINWSWFLLSRKMWQVHKLRRYTMPSIVSNKTPCIMSFHIFFKRSPKIKEVHEQLYVHQLFLDDNEILDFHSITYTVTILNAM